MVIPLAPCQGNWKRKPDIFIILVDLDGLSAYNSGHIISFIAFAMIEPARPEQRQAARLPTIDREPGDKELFKYRPGAVCGPRYSHIV